MKKYAAAILAAVLLLAPLQSVLVRAQEAAPDQKETVQAQEGYRPGDSPAQTGAVDAMSPALHGVILAILHQEAAVFDGTDPELGWEALYNMLSLYGQLDERSEYIGEDLVLPVETAADFAAAIVPSLSDLGAMPEELSDRMVYDPEIDSYLVTCGSDSLAQIQVEQQETRDGALHLSGALVYLVDGSELAQFQAVLAPRDNMFGYTVSQLEIG